MRAMSVMIKPYMPAPVLSREVGKIVIRHGQLDHLQRLMIKSLLGIAITDPLYKQETSKMSGELRRRIKHLARTKLAAHQDLLDELDHADRQHWKTDRAAQQYRS